MIELFTDYMQSDEQPKETRHMRHKNDLESDNESYDSMISEEESFKDIDEKPPKKKLKKMSDDTVLLDEFLDYLVIQKSLSTATSRKHFNNMHKISKRKGYFNITSLLDIPKNYDLISKHELIESQHKTSMEYFINFLGYKFPDIYPSHTSLSGTNQALPNQALTNQALTNQALPSSITTQFQAPIASFSITFNNVPYRDGMAISLVTKY